MDWTGYTPIYVRATGNDGNDGLSEGNAKATAQAAFDVALGAGSGNYVLDFGVGTFAGIATSVAWPGRIGVRGAGSGSNIGGIDASGIDGAYEYVELTDEWITTSPTAGSNVTIVSDLTVNLGIVDCRGGNTGTGYENATNGGNINLTDCVLTEANSSGGVADSYPDASGGNAGSITALRCEPAVSTIALNAEGGYADQNTAGAGGTVTATDCVGVSVNAKGGIANTFYSYGSYVPAGLGGGAVTLVRCSVGNVFTDAGEGYEVYGNGGSINLTDCRISGYITHSGGFNSYISLYSFPGIVTFVGDTWPIPNTGIITTTNLKQGRGINGSSILGII